MVLKIKDFLEREVMIEATFSDLSKLEFNGVYILTDEHDDIVYIGSAYGQTVKKRLQQYLNKSSGGNSLRKKVKKDTGKEPVEVIRKLKITAIHHEDLEYKLIDIVKPKYNKDGNKIVRDGEEVETE